MQLQSTGLGAPLDGSFRRLSAPAYLALNAAERTQEARQVLVRSSQSLSSGSSGTSRPSLQVASARAAAGCMPGVPGCMPGFLRTALPGTLPLLPARLPLSPGGWHPP